MHEVQVEIVKPEFLEGKGQGLLDARVVCAPELCGDEDFVPLDNTLLQGLVYARADFGLVAVALRGVDMSVAGFQGVVDGFFDLAWGGLPCSWILLVVVRCFKRGGT